jgi:DNA topoisomerase-1
MTRFVEDKEDDDCVFDQITSADVNKYLKSIDVDFSAKVFRTRLASSIMHEGLNEFEYDEDATDEEKIADFNSINRRVAVQLNHKKGLTDAVKARLQKDREAIDGSKKELRGLKKEVKESEDSKEIDKLRIRIDKLSKQIKTKELKLRERDQSKEIALDTSKKNYIDPRIVKAWAERVGLHKDETEDDEEEEDEDEEEERVHGVKKVYTTAHMKQFKWAIDNPAFDGDWDYVDTPLDPVVGNKLSPSV